MGDLDAVKVAGVVQVPAELLTDYTGWLAEMGRLARMTPEEHRAAADLGRRLRATERATTGRVPLTLDAVLDALGWSEAYALHVVQPYCTCSDTGDGWETCAHADDEGVSP